MSNLSHQHSSNPMSLASVLNNVTIKPSRADVKSGLPSLDAATFNNRQSHLPPLVSTPYRKGKQSRVKAKEITSSRRSYAYEFRPQQISACQSTADRSHHTKGHRPSRPKYDQEQAIFIWYMRTDLSLSWDKVVHRYNARFSKYRDKSGLRCRFYRELQRWSVAKVREQKSHSNFAESDGMVGKYGVVQRTSTRFEWMEPEHFHTLCLDKFR